MSLIKVIELSSRVGKCVEAKLYIDEYIMNHLLKDDSKFVKNDDKKFCLYEFGSWYFIGAH